MSGGSLERDSRAPHCPLEHNSGRAGRDGSSQTVDKTRKEREIDMTRLKLQARSPQSRSSLKGLVVVTLISVAVVATSAMMVAQQPVLVLTAVLALPLIGAILRWPDVATMATIFILYSNIAVIAVKFHNVPYLVGAAFPMLLAIPLAAYLILRRQKLVFTVALPFLIIFLFVQFLGTLFARNINEAFNELAVFIIEGVAIYVLITNVVRTRQLLRRILWVLLLAGVVLSVVPLYQQVTGNFDNLYGGFGQTSERGFRTGEEDLFGEVRQARLAGAIGEQNRFAQVLLMLVPLGLFQFWSLSKQAKALRLLTLLATVVIFTGVLLTFSRGAAVAIGLMIFIMALMRLIKWRQLAIVLLIMILLPLLLPQYGTRLATLTTLPNFFSPDTNVDDGVFESRTTEMVAAFLVFADHPLIGVGPGMFKYYSATYGDQVNPGVLEGTRESHNLFLGIAADHGVLGLISFLGIIGVTLYELLRSRKWLAQHQPDLLNLVNAFILTIVVYLGTGLFLHLSYARYFWLMMALAGATGAIVRAYRTEEANQMNKLFIPYNQSIPQITGEALS